ncbi:MAG: hypothetical protein EBU46_09900 [Nitrosomonadaceae bacterium]|nr:hypothetical protein [Nitrosomonadaceae bacterium]
MLSTVNSFDVFDTLLARDVAHPTDIFDLVEIEYPYPGFAAARVAAEKASNGTIADIYAKLSARLGVPDLTALRNFELQTEMRHTIPILTNINKLQSSDILVSDMYLTPEDITELLKYHGITAFAKLHVFAGGKHNGFGWEQLKKEYQIMHHTGDNAHSDIIMANRYGIPATLTEAHKFTQLEFMLLSADTSLSLLLRKFRLSNPYAESSIEYRLFDEQARYNIPALLYLCHHIEKLIVAENLDNVLFLTRDGCLVKLLFRALYPNIRSAQFHSSRFMNRNPSADYRAYIRQTCTKGSLLVDLHGSFKTGRELFHEELGAYPRVLLYRHCGSHAIPHTVTSLIHQGWGDLIELLNCDSVGTLCGFSGTRDVRAPPMNAHVARGYRAAVDAFIANCDLECIRSSPAFAQYIIWKNHDNDINIMTPAAIRDPEFCSLTAIANKHKSDKGNEYKCAHHYTVKYEEIIDELANKMGIDKIKLLEIGLNRDDTNSAPSLMMWHEYFHGNVDITGFDIQLGFADLYRDIPNIKIKIGDQSCVADLRTLCEAVPYHLIIDDGYHASQHQQVTFKTLWSALAPGGIFVIEDLHWQPAPETCMKTRTLFEQWKGGAFVSSDFITAEEVDSIRPTISSIEFFDSKSKLHSDLTNSFVAIKKRQ